jgi:hypothetical protein
VYAFTSAPQERVKHFSAADEKQRFELLAGRIVSTYELNIL